MSDPSQEPWSDGPYAPQIPYTVYFVEKANFAGTVICAIFYGIVVILFFRSISALLNPPDRARGNTKWALVAHAVAMFLIVTIYTALTLNLQSISYIDNRGFPGDADTLPHGPIGYQFLDSTDFVPNVMLLLNIWLADGLLLYRCYVIYGKSHWVIAFPFLMYLASFGTGLLLLYRISEPRSIWNSLAIETGIPYFSISFSLNVLLTLMIVAKLVLHNRNIRNALGTQASGLYKAVITVLIESSAIYAITSLLFFGPWVAKNHASDIFLPILAQAQVIAPFLIVIRMASRRSSKPTSDDGPLPAMYAMNSVESWET